MKQINNIPRQVGYSLLQSLQIINTYLLGAQSLSDSSYYSKPKMDMVERNKTFFMDRDITALKSIEAFHSYTQKKLDEEVPFPVGSFITIAKHSTPNLKYVSTPSSVGIVLTTSMLERILELSTLVGSDIIGDKVKDRKVMYCCEAWGFHKLYGEPETASIAFIRILDILRYFNEVDATLMEISLDGIHNDYGVAQGNHRGYYYNTKEEMSAKMNTKFPMLSDRYQHDSWTHYLSTLYNGMVDIDSICAIKSRVPAPILVAELKSFNA